MAKTAFKVDLSRPPEQAEIKTHNRWHPDIPMVEMFKPGRRVPGRMLRLDRRADRERRQRQRRARRRPDQGPLSERPVRRRRRRARRSAGRRPARCRRICRPRLGLHRHLRDARTAAASSSTIIRERARPAGTSTASTRPRATFRACAGPASSIPASSAACPIAGAARPREQARGRAHRHQPRPRAAARAPPNAETALMGQMTGRKSQARGEGGVAHRAAARAWRQLRHQEPVARLPRLLPGLRQGRRPLDGRHPLVAGRRRDHLLRRHRDGGLPRYRRRSHQGRHRQIRRSPTRSSSRARSSRTSPNISSSRASRSTRRRASSTTSTPTSPIAGPASTRSST